MYASTRGSRVSSLKGITALVPIPSGLIRGLWRRSSLCVPDRPRGDELWLCQPLRCTPDKYGETAGGQLGLTAMRRSNPRGPGSADRVRSGSATPNFRAPNRHDKAVVDMRWPRFARMADREQ